MADEANLTEAERAELVAFLDGESEPGVREHLEVKLSRDPAARSEVEALKRTWDLLDYLPRPSPSVDFTARTLDRVAPVRPLVTASGVLGRRRRWNWWPLAAAAVAGLVLGLTLGGRRPPAPLPPVPWDSDPLLLSNLRTIDNLAVYQAIDSLEFLKALDDPELFGQDAVGR